MDIDFLVSLCRDHHVDFVHPGYGFLSEPADFCERLTAAGITFVGPSADILRLTGDKLSARRLAQECSVPILPALTKPVQDVRTLRAFAEEVGMPVMLKAVDGGGGRGIRLVRDFEELEPSFRRAVNESPSGQVFAEKAAVGGYRHVEVQILGDGSGRVKHFYDRECSIQRRFQKVIEIAPSTIHERDSNLMEKINRAVVVMARSIKYSSLGTWEFLVSLETSTFYFMEINPRLQVEHTITEAICGVDLVQCQLLLILGNSFPDLNLGNALPASLSPPRSYAIQLRIAAEDPHHGFSASIGRIRQAIFPGGSGVRVDTHLRAGVIVSTDFDSLVAKVIVVGSNWATAVAKAERILQDLAIDGVSTNVGLLQAIVQAKDFHSQRFNIQWLEERLGGLLSQASSAQRQVNPASPKLSNEGVSVSMKGQGSSEQLVRKGDQFKVKIEGPGVAADLENSTMTVSRVSRNDFPNSLALELSAQCSENPKRTYTLSMEKQTDSQSGTASGQSGAPRISSDASLLICPLAGQLVEVLVDEGDIVNEGEAVAIVRQMKMELEIRAHRSGVVSNLFDRDEGDEVTVGTEICSIIPGNREKL